MLRNRSFRTLVLGGLAAVSASAAFASSAFAADPIVPQNGALLSAFANGQKGLTDEQELAKIEGAMGRKFAMVQRYAPWAQKTFKREAADIARGQVSVISWSPGRFTTAKAITNGSQDGIIRNAALQMKALGGPVLLRLAYEMDQPTNHPGQRNIGPPAEFIPAWRHVYTMFHKLGATNVRFVWNPIADHFKDGTAQAYYPGDAYVDWIGADAFNWYPAKKTWATYSSGILDSFYKWAVPRHKPLIIGETGTMEDPHQAGRKGDWFRDALGWIKQHPAVKAWEYFDSISPKGYDFRIATSAASLKAFVQVANDPYLQGSGASLPNPDPTPNPSPTGGVKFTSFTLSASSASVTNPLHLSYTLNAAAKTYFEAKNSQGNIVRFQPLGVVQAGTHNITWSTRTLAGRALRAGHYAVMIMARADGHKVTTGWKALTITN